MPAKRAKASATVSRSGAANGSALRPRKGSVAAAGGARRGGEKRGAVRHHRLVGLVGAIPFQHGEFRMMQRAALAVAEDAGELEDPRARRPPAASCRRTPARCADRARDALAVGRRPARSRRRADAPRCRARPAGSPARPRRSPAPRTSRAAPRDPPPRAGTAAGRRGLGRPPGRGGGYVRPSRGGPMRPAPKILAKGRRSVCCRPESGRMRACERPRPHATNRGTSRESHRQLAPQGQHRRSSTASSTSS